MKKVFSLVALTLLSLVTVFGLVSCDKKEKGKSVEEIISLLLVNQDEYVDADFYVGNEIKYDKEKDALPISWTSSNEGVLKIGSEVVDIPPAKAGEPSPGTGFKVSVTRPDKDVAEVTLTASITLDGKSATKTFNYRIFAYDVYDLIGQIKIDSIIAADFNVPTVVELDGKSAKVVWSIDEKSTELLEVVAPIEDAKETTIKIKQIVKEETPAELIATVEYNGEKVNKHYTVTLVSPFKAPEQKAPVAGDKVLYGMFQENLMKVLYFTGDMAGYYMSTTENPAFAAQITVEEREGGFDLTFMKGKNKNYIYVEDGGAHINAKFGKEQPATPWTWDAEKGMLVMQSGEKVLTNGTKASGTYDTIGGMDASKELFAAGLYDIPYVAIDHAEEGSNFKLGMYQGNLVKTFYFTGNMDGYYFAVTEDVNAAVTVKATKVEGGYNLSFVDKDGVTQYLYITAGAHINAKFGEEVPATPFTWNAEKSRFEYEIDGEQYYFGNYGTHDLISGTCDAKGESFAATLYAQAGEPSTIKPFEGLPTVAPVAGKEYYLTMGQANARKQVYFTGEMAKFYFAASDDVAKAVKILVEEVEGGFALSFVDANGAKKYIDITVGEHTNAVFGEAALGPWTWNQEANRLERVIDGKAYFLGNWGTYTNIGASNRADGTFVAGLVEAK